MLFNLKLRKSKEVKNFEGETAYRLTPQLELYTAVVTTSLSDKFYEKDNKRIERIRTLIAKNDAEFTAKLAVYAREKMNLRSIPLVMAVELAKANSGNPIVAKAVEHVVNRVDEIMELLAYYALANERSDLKKLNKLSKQIQKGLIASFNKFDEYQFAKYNRDAEIKLRDALFIVHPKAKNEDQQKLFDKIAKNELAVPYTWETEFSAAGQLHFENEIAKRNAFKAKWEELIDSGKIGYMAMLRNLRNIIEAEVSDEHFKKVCNYIGDANAVAKSKQLPFRFLAAYRELKQVKSGMTSMVMNALEDAVSASAANIKGYDYNTRVVIACDVSGSMQKSISAKSRIMNYDIGLMLGMLLQSRCKNVITGMFGDRWKIINMSQRSVLANVEEFYKREGEVGYATNGYLVIKDLIDRKVKVDKIMMFTDCQLWNNNPNTPNANYNIVDLWKQYRKISPDAKLYLFDLAGYGNTPLRIENNNVFLIAGWSDKIFDMLAAIENGSNAVEEVMKIEL